MKPLIFSGYSIHFANPIASERFESALERSELACERSESASERPEMDGWTGHRDSPCMLQDFVAAKKASLCS